MPPPFEPKFLENVVPFPIRQIASVPIEPPDALWLVESIWTKSGVGIVGGLPKSGKTWLAAEIGLAVASGQKALGKFAVYSKGPVLIFDAEDPPGQMRARFESLALARGIGRLDDLPVSIIDTNVLYLDDPEQIQRLAKTISTCRPRMLILDPFVRLAPSVDENSAREVSQVLGMLRALQREFDLAVLLVHHLRKSPASRLGQQLRGSSDFAAWYDSGLYLLEQDNSLVLHTEHRSAKAPPPIRLHLHWDTPTHLVVDEIDSLQNKSVLSQAQIFEQELLGKLKTAEEPITTVELRAVLHARKATVLDVLRRLQQRGLIQRISKGWKLKETTS